MSAALEVKNRFREELSELQKVKPKNRRYSEEFQRAVSKLIDSGIHRKEIKKELSISHHAISSWGHKFATNASVNLATSPRKIDSKLKYKKTDFVQLKLSKSKTAKIVVRDDSVDKLSSRIVNSCQRNAPYTLTTPSGYSISSLSKNDLIFIIHSLEHQSI